MLKGWKHYNIWGKTRKLDMKWNKCDIFTRYQAMKIVMSKQIILIGGWIQWIGMGDIVKQTVYIIKPFILFDKNQAILK